MFISKKKYFKFKSIIMAEGSERTISSDSSVLAVKNDTTNAQKAETTGETEHMFIMVVEAAD